MGVIVYSPGLGLAGLKSCMDSGLGIHDLKSLGCPLRMRWLWLAKSQPNRPWAEFKIMLHPSVHAFFSRAVFTVVGDGKSTLFWTDK